MNSLGQVIMTQAVSRTTAMAVFAGIGVAFVLFFCLFSYTKKANVSGVLVATRDLTRVLNAQPSIVFKRLVAEGQKVQAGAVLFDLMGSEAKRDILVLAPLRGTVTMVSVEKGQMVGRGQTLAVIEPEDAQLEAALYVPASIAGFLAPGMPVQLRYTAYPYRKVGLARGVVQEVGTAAMARREIPALASDFQTASGSTPVYRVRVRLEGPFVFARGSNMALRAGSTVEASLLLQRRRLIEWAFSALDSSGGCL